ncbi:ABC transporter ATP-binding protein [Haliangium ochraceum]|uniref:Heme exporter protein CcmA n=1 Tax=Haliangium ochraceum (strain DSM 14365 / JCM 11303 / SMP-2) TaxID=502025 RepID=D0LV15_HALO1|nr:ABC transporter ATP-binding protein [Haliangium ochraceum]ACY15856.1 heme exporter protein CcmA [Haliangium ochraceum DSM 14365]
MSVVSVQVDKLSKRYGHHRALGGVSCELRAGSMCALLGPNGAGKSTLLGILSTLVKPTGGSVRYADQAGDEIPARDVRRHIGVLAHSSLVYGELSAIENLLFYGRLYQVADLEARARALLDEVGLDDKARQRPARTYSRGMTQRLSLARALLHDPRVLLLDEPFTGLDRTGARALVRSMAEAKQRGCILLVVTHDLESIGGLTDHVLVLKRGKAVFEEQRAPGPGDGAEGGAGGFSYAELKDVYHQHTE